MNKLVFFLGFYRDKADTELKIIFKPSPPQKEKPLVTKTSKAKSTTNKFG